MRPSPVLTPWADTRPARAGWPLHVEAELVPLSHAQREAKTKQGDGGTGGNVVVTGVDFENTRLAAKNLSMVLVGPMRH